MPYGASCSGILLHCLMEPHAMTTFMHFPREPRALETFMHFSVEPHALENLRHYSMEPHALATFILVLWSFMYWQPPSCRSWSLDIGKIVQPFTSHTLYWLTPPPPHTHTFFGSDTHTYGSKQHTFGQSNTFTTHKWLLCHFSTLSSLHHFFYDSNNTLLISQLFYISSNLLSFSSIQSTFSFLLSHKSFQNNFLSFHKELL